jgi:hypothetical protein
MFFNRQYILDSLAARKGECRQCGYCCKGCNFLKDNKCSTYNNRPEACHKDNPIDEFERKAYCSKDCGYYWDD